MRRIIVTTFMSMDGVLQAPGGPEEDRTGHFKYGGWQFGYNDEESGAVLMKILSGNYDLLLGRRTYEIFSAYWPFQDGFIADKFNSIHKYVVGTSTIDTSWKDTTQIRTDVVNELERLRQQEGPDLLVHGSSVLAQTLFAHKLVDVFHACTYPLTLGEGKKLFAEGAAAQPWKLTEHLVSPKGVIIASYVPDGAVRTGSFVAGKPSAAELARRKKWAQEELQNKS